MNELTRRSFLWYAAGIVGWGAFLSLPHFFQSSSPARPPGAVQEDEFMATCIRCTRCVDVCPRDAIRPASFRDSIVHVGTPIFTGPCHRCLKCVESCPSGALQSIEAAAVRTGSVEIDDDECVGCQLCLEGCDFNALKPIREGDKIRVEVLRERCIGCGECIPHCPLDEPALRVVNDGEERQKWKKNRGVVF